jgi:hypothetical protein
LHSAVEAVVKLFGSLVFWDSTSQNVSGLCYLKQIKMKVGDKVLIRTYSAGVHFGELVSQTGQEVHLKNARRLWSWKGALSLSEVSTKGVEMANSKISEAVDEIILLQMIEMMPLKSNLASL